MKLNKISFIIIFFSFIVRSSFCNAQIFDSVDAYNYWAQRGIIEMVYAFMMDYNTDANNKITEDELKAIADFKNRFIIDGFNNNNIPNLDSVSYFLKANHWGKTEKNIFQTLRKNYINTISLDESFFKSNKSGMNDPITKIPDNNGNNINKNKNWNNKKDEIISNYKRDLEKIANNKEDTSQKITNNDINADVNRNLISITNFSRLFVDHYLFIIIVFLSGLIIGGWVVFQISRIKTYKILSYEKSEYLKLLKNEGKKHIFKHIGLIYILWKQKNKYKKQCNEIDTSQQRYYLEKIEKLKQEVSVLKKNSPESNYLSMQNLDESGTVTINDEAKSNGEFENFEKRDLLLRKSFYSMPESDGSFLIENGEPSNDGRKYYRIEYLESSNEGKLFYISGDRDKRAINRLESYLKPVCEIENIINAETATRIDFLLPGKVFRTNNNWVIDHHNKVKIRLI